MLSAAPQQTDLHSPREGQEIISRPVAPLLRGRRGRRGKTGLSHTEITDHREGQRRMIFSCPEWLRGPFPYRMLRYRANPVRLSPEGVGLVCCGAADNIYRVFDDYSRARRDAMRRILSENSEHAHAYSQVSLSSRLSSAASSDRRERA
jgi:hypothetical protein